MRRLQASEARRFPAPRGPVRSGNRSGLHHGRSCRVHRALPTATVVPARPRPWTYLRISTCASQLSARARPGDGAISAALPQLRDRRAPTPARAARCWRIETFVPTCAPCRRTPPAGTVSALRGRRSARTMSCSRVASQSSTRCSSSLSKIAPGAARTSTIRAQQLILTSVIQMARWQSLPTSTDGAAWLAIGVCSAANDWAAGSAVPSPGASLSASPAFRIFARLVFRTPSR